MTSVVSPRTRATRRGQFRLRRGRRAFLWKDFRLDIAARPGALTERWPPPRHMRPSSGSNGQSLAPMNIRKSPHRRRSSQPGPTLGPATLSSLATRQRGCTPFSFDPIPHPSPRIGHPKRANRYCRCRRSDEQTCLGLAKGRYSGVGWDAPCRRNGDAGRIGSRSRKRR